jgi:hypothetical protein
MLDNLFLSATTMVVCLVIQSLLGALAVDFYAKLQTVQLHARSFARTMLLLVLVMLVLLFGNLIQVAVWAQLFVYLDEFQSYADAFYHSAVNFATLGYGDIVMSERHRLLGPMQAINGVLMVGVSTAVVMAALQDALRAVTDDVE